MSIEVGSKLEGKVTGITNFGAFVQLPSGQTGLVHISEVADNYVKDINDHLKVGEMVEVKVMNVEADGKIGLSIRKAKPQPAGGSERPQRPRSNNRTFDRQPKENFETKMAKFLKESEDNLSSLKRATESKRGGRGARRG
ncbi:S1 domain-containing RNA-binding protein [Planomicrobium sp. YIM 101495]|uniref:S1 domain-containing RNA-binding protein n=1 Tax=Planomicrobium sp. YIM 101495 TaxID=2665160 RepID=UPI0012B70D9C|nr:S1 domain-containing RNA-binding protein [Planomicrobium sp. YIM 101495]MTD32173.1 RNA-binding protein S1 [Planomicrobium sp. YIM 101495]